jgi:hypothetical protein
MIYYLIGGRNRQKIKTNAFVALSVLGSTSALLSIVKGRPLLTLSFDRFVTSSFWAEDTKTILLKQLRYQKISISCLILLIISIINTHITLRMTVISQNQPSISFLILSIYLLKVHIPNFKIKRSINSQNL